MSSLRNLFRSLLGLVIGAGVAVWHTGTAAAEPLKVVATLSSYADIARTIGGERVAATAIVAPRYNPHFIEPRPSDVVRLKRADLFIHSGLDLEAWRGPLVDAAGRAEVRPGGDRELDLSAGIPLLEIPPADITRAHGDIHIQGNPHFWLSPLNGLIIARAIGAKLEAIDPESRDLYRANTARFVAQLNEAIARWRGVVAPFHGQPLVGYHNEWVYLTTFLGLRCERFLEPKPGIPPSPHHIAEIEDYIRVSGAKAIVQSTVHPTAAAEAVRGKTGVAVVRICQNVGELPEASDYITMIDFNITSLVGALRR